ncbi:MAG: nitrate/nitrite transporter [Acidiferrobacterales bacterium]
MSPVRLTVSMCVAEVFSMLGTFTFAALLPTFISEWQLTNTKAGWLSAIFLAGYAAAVPFLVSLTDRVDPRRIYLTSMLLGGLASLGFALLAQGFWTALLFRALAGVSLAGTYMPGLKALSDRIEGSQQPRAVAFYTSSFGIGVAFSFFVSGVVGAWLSMMYRSTSLGASLNWQWAFAVGAAGSVVAFLIVARVLGPSEPQRAAAPTPALFDFRPVLRNRSAMAYILSYTAHNWELFGMRSWVVALLAFTQLRHGDTGALSPTVVATLMTLLGVWASITGNELAMRFGRRRLIIVVMLSSAILCGFIGFTSALSYMAVAVLCLVHGVTVNGESAAVTAGAIGTAAPGYRGTTMAIHSGFGFSFAFLGPLAFGWILDLAGGESSLGWGLAYGSLGVVMVLGLIVFAALNPDELPGDRKTSS